MYRIRLATGEEAVYRTVQELAQAVASGMVSPNAEVYHKAANRWLPVNTHPDYRAAMATGQQTAINPAISIPGPAAAGTPPAPAAPPATPKTPSGKSPALTVGPPPTAKQPTPPKAPAADPPARKRTSKSTAIPEDLDNFELLPPGPVEEPSKQQTRQSAAIQLTPPTTSGANTTRTTAIDPTLGPPPVGLPLPPEAQMIDLTAEEPPIILAPPPAPVLPPPVRPPLLERSKLVLIASIAALVFAVGITALIVVKSRPRTAVVEDSTQQAGISPPPADSAKDSVIAVVPPPKPSPAKPVTTPAKPVTTPPAPATTPARTTGRPAPVPENYPAPSKPVVVATPKRDTAPTPPAPGAVKPKAAGNSKTPSYFQAYADARSEMDQSLSYVNFRRVFAPGRFATMDSLRATKRMVVAAGNILRVYRGREVQLEQTFRPDDPGGRNSLREPFETSEASRSLLSDVDSLFTLLVNQEGEITVSATEIRFRSARGARAYNDMRREILSTLATWRDSAEASNRVTMPRLVQALSAFQPPLAR